MQKRTLLSALACGLALGLAALGTTALAQPGRQPIRIVVPAPAGSAPDVVARLIGEQFRARFGQTVVVENRAGAGGIVAVNAVRGTEPNGTTLLFAQAAVVTVTPHTYKEAKYDMERDFETVGAVAYTPMLFVANVDKGPKSWAEAVQQLKAQPGQLAVGNPTRTSIPHLAAERAGQAAGGSFQNVSFSNTGQGIQAVVNGDTLMYVDGTAPLVPLVKAGRLRALAVASDKVLPGLEGIPLANEQVPGLEVSGWFMLFASKGTPRPVLEQLNQAMNAALKTPEVADRMRDLGNYPLGGSLADATAFLQREKQQWAEVIRKSNLQPE
jgi:tripartite-type tricarboxylate transporter receptor subunit TctC